MPNRKKQKAGKIGGSVKSKKKRLAAIANGKKGGRPRKDKTQTISGKKLG